MASVVVDRIDRYEILAELGRGATGGMVRHLVYLAEACVLRGQGGITIGAAYFDPIMPKLESVIV